VVKNFLVTGCLGQIGTELVKKLRCQYGSDHVVGSDIKTTGIEKLGDGPFEILDVRESDTLVRIVEKYNIDTILHLAGLLSAVGEAKPQLAWQINAGGLFNTLEVAREKQCAVFFPSSIAAFGPNTPLDHTPQDTIQRPATMYGITKVTGELLCDYYHKKYGLDTRGVRFPGLISYETEPGGGTTDYAVEIYYKAIADGHYDSFIAAGTYMDMMYMPDAIDAVIQLMEADSSKLKHRNAFNISAMSFDPEELAASIRKYIPHFTLGYKVDPVRQSIAESWPNSLDVSAAREEWGFDPKYDLDKMTDDMLAHLKETLKVKKCNKK